MGMAASGIQGRAGLHLEQLRLVCRAVNQLPPPPPVPIAPLGVSLGADGEGALDLCSEHGALVGIYGRVDTEAGRPSLVRLGGLCRALERVRGVLGIRSGCVEHITPAAGGDHGTARSARCPPGHALVGVTAWAGALGERSDVGARCAPIAAWEASGVAAITALAPFAEDAIHLDAQTADCPRGSYLVGFEIASSRIDEAHGGRRVIDRIVPVCRDL
jgi:hypothetical protein